MLDVITDSIYPARISVEGGFFKEIVPIVINDDSELDISGIILPGFIDSHIHIESTMLTPAQFAKLAVRFGTTSVVCDPHEIANVAGTDGIDFMIENSKSVPFNFYFSIPSCVPATCFEISRCDRWGWGSFGQTGKSKRTWKTYRRSCASAFRKRFG